MPTVQRARGRGRGRAPGAITRLPGGGLPPRGPMPAPGAPGVKPGRISGGAGGPMGQGQQTPPGQGGVHPQPGIGARGKGQGQAKGQGVGVGGAALPGPGGRQLAARVASGAITQEQADRTMKQRQTLAKALGPDWREKLSVGGQSFAEVNKGLKANPDSAKLAALRKKLLENRKTVLAGARSKLKGGEDEGTEGGKKKRRRPPAEEGQE